MKKENSYYGPYFWLCLIAFVVPIFVAYKAFDKISPTTKPVPNPDASGVDHALWDYLLKAYVENGLVDYEGMKSDYLFKTYLQQLGGADIDALETEDEKLALLCNAYNAFVINGVINHKIKSTVQEISAEDPFKFFDLTEHLFGNRTLSLNELEHKIIRPTYKEPRVHVALVCAAKSCPVIRAEAFIGNRIREQLEDQAVLFANNSSHVKFDEKENAIYLSSILSWYGEDWDASGGYLSWIKERVKDETLAKQIELAETKKVAVKFSDYDWSLNTQGKSSAYAGGKTIAGSGSIPNE